jgi:hypothetical protein
MPPLKRNNPEVGNFLLKYTESDPPEGYILRNCYLLKSHEKALKKSSVLLEGKYFCVHKQKNR